MVKKCVVCFWLVVFQVHVFNVPLVRLHLVGQIQGVLSSKYHSKFGQIHLSIEASVARHTMLGS